VDLGARCLKCAPEIKGVSKQPGFEGRLEILSYSYVVKPARGMSVTFRHCMASPKLMQCCAIGVVGLVLGAGRSSGVQRGARVNGSVASSGRGSR
jgi:hypothetical protein